MLRTYVKWTQNTMHLSWMSRILASSRLRDWLIERHCSSVVKFSLRKLKVHGSKVQRAKKYHVTRVVHLGKALYSHLLRWSERIYIWQMSVVGNIAILVLLLIGREFGLLSSKVRRNICVDFLIWQTGNSALNPLKRALYKMQYIQDA